MKGVGVDVGRHSIGDVAALTGVSAGTLRAWENRYGVVAPSRTPSAYRSYSPADVETVRRMRVLVESGVPARRAAVLARDPLPETAAAVQATPTVPGGSPLADHDALTAIAARFDPVALRRTLDEAFAHASVERVIDDWLMPSMTVLGRAWEAQRVDVAAEHFVTAAVMRRLAALFEASGSSGPRVLVGLPPKARHELPVLAFAVCLRRAGVEVVYLGADVPVTSWAQVAAATAPEAAVIAATHSRDLDPSAATVEALHEARVPVVYVGGRAAHEVRGGVPLPSQLTLAAHLVRTALA
ncbi:MerR family transcriptional regulator [Pedococcus sp. NPDC057267]|uniref:MerR family transcriptional regulator n=1 Tax=Pedococcus sp. NPDC057267 TaxID=3346077 RepID=UPI003626609B